MIKKSVQGQLGHLEQNESMPYSRAERLSSHYWQPVLGFLAKRCWRPFPRMSSSWKLDFWQLTHTTCTVITLELLAHILPWVIAFRPYPSQHRPTWNGSARISEESTYLMLTSWDLASKQTWSQLLCRRLTSRSPGWVGEEAARKGRCKQRKDRREKGQWMDKLLNMRVSVG